MKPIKIIITDDETGEPLYEEPPNDRMLEVTIRDIRRRRTVQGTCTLARWVNIVDRVRKRWPRACMSSRGKFPITIRTCRGGRLVVIATALEGTVVGTTTRH